MITFSTKRADIKRRALDVTSAELLVFTIIAAIMFALSLYFLIVGFLSDKEALSYGFIMLAASIFIISLYVVFFLKFKKQAELFFDKNSIDGVIDYELEKDNDRFTLRCVQSNSFTRFSKSDITYIRPIGKTIVVKLKDRRILPFPKTDDTLALLKQP